MNNLPYEVLYKIYEYKHQLEYKDVINELKNIKITCCFTINLNIANMVYLNHDKFFVKCINIDNVYITSKQILNTIKYDKC